MSVIKFELKEDHIKLLKHLEWQRDFNGENICTSGENPFGGFDHYEDMGVILYGQPEGFNPLEDETYEWSEEQKEEMDKLLSELPTALDIILNIQSFKPGFYKTRYHLREWKELKQN